ncbi:hypothetical protein MN086_07455 [Sulfurovum sp. XGS-02]|uniref:hypothetical protein n=1 Tax=Sulfurovum sp. XGS-02 TaxID=2925411 RepID=UPI00205438A8|nr:hypothetical protein [Sulfurovum sp. XGS-02]UPT76888.1 hypothetical protein MN086_07455 [Sulfurovum sp. XGS-02]
MQKQNNYDGSVIYNEIQIDIEKQKTMIFVSGVSFLVLLIVIVPMAFWWFFGLLFHADLPFFNHGFIMMASNTKLFLLPYNILLIFYFLIMYFKDQKLHLVNKEHFNKAIRYFVLSLVIAILPYIFASSVMLTIIYFVFFILTIYHLSFTYYDVELHEVHNIHNHLYRNDDLGWMSSMGMLDNPFSVKDDINRGKLFVQTSTLGFDFIALFINMIVRTIVFSYGIRYKQYIQESARLFDMILEENLNGEYAQYSVPSKVILESLNYVSFRNGKVVLYEHGEAVSKLVEIKEQK